MPAVTLYVDAAQDLRHTSYVYTGLFALARHGEITLRIRHPAASDWRKSIPGDLSVHVTLRHSPDAEPVAVCFDLRDQSYLYYHATLERCDIYFKRSYFQPDVDVLPAAVRSKVRPFGLTYPCSDHRSYAAIAASVARGALRSAGRPADLPTWAHKLLDYGRLPHPTAFAHPTTAPKEPVIVFQPRLWDQSELRGECAETINDQRIEVVIALRRAFGERFQGGLVPTPLSRDRYPELLSRIHPRSYPKLARRSLIGIYTRGLHHSTAWKLAEYFAASSCVVAEPIRNQPALPLEVGAHYLPFVTADECVEQCARILDGSGLAEQMRSAAHGYFSRDVEPVARMRRCIEQLSVPPNGSRR